MNRVIVIGNPALVTREVGPDAGCVDQPLPPLFFALADQFVQHLKNDGTVESKEVVLIDRQAWALCIAGGLDQSNSRDITTAVNYIYAALGLELDPVVAPTQERLQVPPLPPAQPVKPGLVYILRNESMPGRLKIGFTCQTLAERVRQLSSSTSIPTPFHVVSSFWSATPWAHEQRIHGLLGHKRAPGREFFLVTEAEAVAACKQVIGAAE